MRTDAMKTQRWHRFTKSVDGTSRYVDLSRLMAWDADVDGGTMLHLEGGVMIWIRATEQEVAEALSTGGEDLRPYSERLLAIFKETDAKRGLNAADTSNLERAAGAMKDLLLSMGMEWSDAKGDYVLP